MAALAAVAPASLGAYLTPSEAARRAGVSSARIVQLVRAGKLPCVETSLGRLIRLADVDEYARERAERAQRRGGLGEAPVGAPRGAK